MIPVFVYGTLKNGYGNHVLLQDSQYIGCASLENYGMVYSNGKYGFPVIFKNKLTIDHTVIGEMYLVDQKTLMALDQLEANGVMYKRKMVTVYNENEIPMDVYVYIGINDFWNNFEGMEPVGKKVHNWKR